MSEQQIEPRQLRRQLIKRYPQKVAAGDRDPTTVELLQATLATINKSGDIHQSLMERLRNASGEEIEDIVLSDEQAALLAWVDEAFRVMFKEFGLDASLAAQVQELLPVVAGVAISQRDFLLLEEHPLVQLIDVIYIHCVSWHRGLGRAGQAPLAKIEESIGQCLDFFESQEMGFDDILRKLKAFLAEEVSRADRMRERVVASEQGKLKASSARTTAGHKLNEIMEGKRFPVAVLEFLHGAWYDSMQLTLITLGPDSEEWRRMLKLTETLVWTMQPFEPNDDQRRQTLYKIIPKIPRELRELLISLFNDVSGLDDAINTIEDAHFRLLRNRPAPFVDCTPIKIGPTDIRTNVAEQMLEQLKPLKTGQWFVIRADDGSSQRVRLALKMNEYQQLLFVNRSGVKALQKTFEEFAYLLTSQVARPLAQRPALSLSLRWAAGLKTDVRRVDPGNRAPAQADATLAQAEATAVDADTSFESMAPETAPAESTAVISEEKKREAARRLQQRRKERAEKKTPRDDGAAQLNPELQGLAIGSWITFRDGKEEQLCKLAVRIDSLDKFIFVNGRGTKQRELSGTELTELQKSGACELKSGGASFEESVASVVRGFREDLSEDAQ